jgi:hypothetical protein
LALFKTRRRSQNHRHRRAAWHPSEAPFRVRSVDAAGGANADETDRKETPMSDTSATDPQFATVPGAVTQRFTAAPLAAPQGPETASDAIASELGAMADALEHVPFTSATLSARLRDDPHAKNLAALAALGLILQDLSPSDAATLNRILAEGPRPKRDKRK